jgi:VIT1/CCC1 family predicted Fe2+/Mn2+ transporter
LFGFLPLIPYIIGYSFLHDNETQYLLPCLIIAGVLFFILGLAKGSLIRQRRLKSAIETLVLGGIAVGVGYGIGLVF